MTTDRWGDLEQRAQQATPGPWTYRDMTPNTYGPAFVDASDVRNLAICGDAVGRSETHGFCLQVDTDLRMANAAFIAAANPQAILQLIEHLRQSKEREAVAVALLERGVKEALPDAMIFAAHTDLRRSRKAVDTMKEWANEARAFVAKAALAHSPDGEG